MPLDIRQSGQDTRRVLAVARTVLLVVVLGLVGSHLAIGQPTVGWLTLAGFGTSLPLALAAYANARLEWAAEDYPAFVPESARGTYDLELVLVRGVAGAYLATCMLFVLGFQFAPRGSGDVMGWGAFLVFLLGLLLVVILGVLVVLTGLRVLDRYLWELRTAMVERWG